jgi:hypothetical protein
MDKPVTTEAELRQKIELQNKQISLQNKQISSLLQLMRQEREEMRQERRQRGEQRQQRLLESVIKMEENLKNWMKSNHK